MLHLLFFRGHGIVPVLVRLFCWHWWTCQHWRDVPAHVAVAVPTSTNALYEYEAIVSGIQVSLLAREEIPKLTGLIASVEMKVPNPEAASQWLDSQVGQRYGFEAVALTGLAVLSPSWLDLTWARCWASLQGGKSGRTSPLHCSLLCRRALEAGGYKTTLPDFPPISPNDLMLGLKS